LVAIEQTDRSKYLKHSWLISLIGLLAVSASPAAPNTPSVQTAILRNPVSLDHGMFRSARILSDRRRSLTLSPDGQSQFGGLWLQRTATVVSPAHENPQSQSEPVQDLSSSPRYLEPALFVGGALALTAALIRTDQGTYNTLYDWKQDSSPIKFVSPIITNLGDGRASMAIFGGFLAYSYVESDRTALQAGKIGLESFIVSGIAAQILKHTFGRERPSVSSTTGGRWNGAFFLLNQGSGKRGGYAHFDAFPSGHTATVFAAATTLAEVYHNTPWVSYASYSVASTVAISRIMEQTHWLSDCFVGGLIGYFSTKLVLHFNASSKPVALVPIMDGQFTGLALNVGL
jgi:membrane-associated phospholipid phosphatase